jgi:UDP-N-acetylmuramate--alanine ligase
VLERLNLRTARLHFAGVGGSGMSALAQYLAMRGGHVTGSDRDFDRGGRGTIRRQLEAVGVEIVPQDGSGVAVGCDAVIASTAVESQVPDAAAARERGVPIVHRSELLAHLANGGNAIAVAGSSGKSTVVAMIYDILCGAGLEPSLLSGGNVMSLADLGYMGNAWAGRSEVLVIEADESDGSLVRYTPEVGVVLNLHRDHKEPDELLELFRTFRDRTRQGFVIGEDDVLAPLRRSGDRVFGTGPDAALRATGIILDGRGVRFDLEWAGATVPFRLPVPGRHNVLNALAAIGAGLAIGLAPTAMQGALATFRGVARRFQSVGVTRGVEVIDDFAHNPQKIEATLAAAHAWCGGRLLAVYQPHGFGPTRFVREALADTFARGLEDGDRLWLLPIYDAGGTAQRDLSSADLAGDVAARGHAATAVDDRSALIATIADVARDGDLVLVMGARDPSLTDLCRAMLAAL